MGSVYSQIFIQELEMKKSRLLIPIVSFALVGGVLTGCGGGSDGGGVSPTPPQNTGLSSEKVGQFASKLSESMGCSYTPVAEAQNTANSSMNTTMEKSVSIIKKVILPQGIVTNNLLTLSNLPNDTSSYPGDCGGEAIIDANEQTGTLLVTLNNYCTENADYGGIKTVLDGSVDIAFQQKDTSMHIQASTVDPLNIKATNPETKEKTDTTITLNTLIIDATGKADKLYEEVSTSLSYEKIDVSAVSIGIVDNIGGTKISITDLQGSVDLVAKTARFNATVDALNNDTGPLKINGNANADGSVAIDATDINGKKATLQSTDTKGIFNVGFDGKPVGKMDCSMVSMPKV